MNPVVWFEIPVSNLDRAKKFYEKVFEYDELTITEIGEGKMAWLPGKPDQPGSTGSLFQAKSYVPSHEGTVVYLGVEDIEGTLKRVEENGGKTLASKMSIGEYGFVAHFEDCEGNRVALHAMQ